MEALVRPAVPEDARAAAQLIYLAGKSHLERSIYDLMFPGEMEERISKLAWLFTAQARSFFHYSHYLVGEVDGEVAGCLCGFNDAESGGALLRDAFLEMGMDRVEGRAMFTRLLPFHRVNPGHHEDSWVVEHVAVFPRFQGRGVAAALLHEILARGRERGFGRCELNMLTGNTQAMRTYRRAGFSVVEETSDEEFMSIFATPGMQRLCREL